MSYYNYWHRTSRITSTELEALQKAESKRAWFRICMPKALFTGAEKCKLKIREFATQRLHGWRCGLKEDRQILNLAEIKRPRWRPFYQNILPPSPNRPWRWNSSKCLNEGHAVNWQSGRKLRTEPNLALSPAHVLSHLPIFPFSPFRDHVILWMQASSDQWLLL